tara:strand:+ start:1035 stop:1772 length:738 start_codon:yes stop_codon:yes gene_type:complete
MARDMTNKKEQLPSEINFAEDANVGFEDLTQQDVAIPFFVLLQKMSPQLDSVEGAKAGQVFNTVTEEVCDELKVIPCAYKREFVEWTPRDAGGGLVAQHSIDSEAVQKATRSADGRLISAAGNWLVETAYHFVLAVTKNGLERGLLTMTSTQLKKNRRWNSLMSGIKLKDSKGNSYTPARYSHVYKLTSSQEKNDKGSWYGWNIELESQVLKQDVYSNAKEFAGSIQSGDVKTTAPVQEEETKHF